MLPPSVRDWLPEGHLSYFISDTIDALDLSGFYRPYQGDGRRNSPFDPRMMVKILTYAYATGTFSSRKIAKKLEEDVAFRALCAGNFPSHRTIAEFRERHLQEFRELFGQVVRIGAEVDLVKMGTLAVDGTKVRASASKHKAMSYGRMKQEQERLAAEIAELTARARQTDVEEDALYGAENRGDELPSELRRREERLSKIEQAVERLRARQVEEDRAQGRKEEEESSGKKSRFKRKFGEPEEKKQDNFTDPQSRIMKTSVGFEQCYNAQLAVDGERHLIRDRLRGWFRGWKCLQRAMETCFPLVCREQKGDAPMARQKSTPLRTALSRMFPAALLKRLASETGTVRRQRRVDPVKLFWVVVLTLGSGRSRSFAGFAVPMSGSRGRGLSASSFYNRFTPAFTRFLRELLGVGLEKLNRCAGGTWSGSARNSGYPLRGLHGRSGCTTPWRPAGRRAAPITPWRP